MHIDCPKCERPVDWDGSPRGLDQVLKCTFCGHRFSSQDPQASVASQPPTSEVPMEVWELGFDGEDPNTGGLDDLLDDFDFVDSEEMDASESSDFLAPSMELSLQNSTGAVIPDIPNLPSPVSKFIKMSGDSNWSNMLDDADEGIPALPPLGFELVEASTSSLAPQQVDVIHSQTEFLSPAPAASTHTNNAPVSFASKPPPGSMSPEKEAVSISDLLESFVSEPSEKEKTEETRYYIQRKEKEFGPFTEREVMQLLESRKLNGDELARTHDDFLWIPLEEFEDFGPTIDVLRKVKVRVGWEKRSKKRRNSQSVPAEEHSPANGHSQTAPPFPPSVEERDVVSSPPPKDKRKSFRGVLYGMTLLLLLGGVGVWWLSKEPKPKAHVVKKKSSFSINQLAINDRIDQYRILLRNVVRSYRTGKFSFAWHNVRFAYYLLDSYGNDSTIRAGADRILQKLRKRKQSQAIVQRIALARAVSMKNSAKVSTLLQPIQTKLAVTHPEWGFLLARSLEVTGKYDTAQVIYTQLLNKHPKHVRAMLGLYRVFQALNKPYRASSFLLRAFRAAPDHLPSQLQALSYAINRGTWLTFRKKIRSNIKRIIKNNLYTQGGLAQWYALQANNYWRLRQTAKAIYRMDQAVTLAPKNRKYRWRRIQLYLWAKRPHRAQQAINEEKDYDKNYKKNAQLRIWSFKALLQWGSKKDILKHLTPIIQKAISDPQERYLSNYLLALSHLKQKNVSDAIESCENANQVKGHKMTKPFARLLLLHLYDQSKRWDKVTEQLEALEKIGYTSPLTEYYKGITFLRENAADDAKKLAKKLQSQTPTNYLGYVLSAQIASAEKNLGRSLRFYRKALLYHPERPSSLLMRMGDLSFKHKNYTNAFRLYDRYSKLLEGEIPCTLISKKLETLYKLKLCSKLLKISIKRCPKFRLHLLRGQCAERLHRISLALKEYQTARRRATDLEEPIRAIANLYYNQKNYTKATKLYTALYLSKPQKREYLLRLIRLHRRARRNRKAMQLLRNYNRAVDPKDDFELQLETIHLLIATSKIWRAKRQLRKMRKTFITVPQQIKRLYIEAGLFHKLKKHRRAIKSYSELLAISNKEYNAYLKRASEYYRIGNYKKCYQDARTFLQNAPLRDPQRKTGLIVLDACKPKK